MKEDLNARVVACPECSRLTIVKIANEDGVMLFSACSYCGKKIRKRNR